MHIEEFLNFYSLIALVLIPIYLFPPINDKIKESRYRKIIDISMVLLFIATLAFGYYDQVKSKVTISPEKYISKPQYQEFQLFVTNNNNYPIYDYAVVIMVSKGDLNVNTDLNLEPYEEMHNKKSEIPFDAFGIGGTSDKYGLSWMELYFPSLEANSSKKFLVKINGEKYKSNSTILFSIGRFSKEPNPKFRMPVKMDKNGNLPKKMMLPGNMEKN